MKLTHSLRHVFRRDTLPQLCQVVLPNEIHADERPAGLPRVHSSIPTSAPSFSTYWLIAHDRPPKPAHDATVKTQNSQRHHPASADTTLNYIVR